MRVQHNIPAMNAYRNYNNNASGINKNLEKLSSGYKINRAGDDAAGLAISEKMRAQITGLEVAQKNAKDGISLVQTAEGALTEVQDMLNRMYKLAEQSANGTYSDDVDRVQLQKEVGKLRDEIDRIATTANFNGSKLLDGTLAGNGNGATSTNGTAGTNGTTTTIVDGATVAADDHTGVTADNFADMDVDLADKTFTATASIEPGAPALIFDGIPEGYTATVTAKDSSNASYVLQNPDNGQYAAAQAAGTVVVTLAKSDGTAAGSFELDLSALSVSDDASENTFSMTFSAAESATNGNITTTTKSVTTAMGSQKVTSFNIDGGLVLWVGAEADKANALDVTVDSVKTSALAIDKIDISTQQGGLNALGYIEAAINKVSDIRGGLGATQNRLEHTINNLSVMQENMQDAESTIRDTDVAEEMMKYTKNSILVQSAQAMLAQANQLPQGVLQLLQ